MGKRTEASAELYMLEEGDGDGDDDSSGDMSETASSNEAQVGCHRANFGSRHGRESQASPLS